MKNLIACRPGCCNLALPEALAALKGIGVDNVEVTCPGDDDYDGLLKAATDAGANISSLSIRTRVDKPESVAKLEAAIQGAARIGTPIIFLSAALKSAGYDEGIEALKGLAEKARDAGVTLSLETHPPFGHNGDIACQTIEAVKSPGLGYNFDTANIYYYNEGVDTVEELKKALSHVASVHLKESAKGEPKSPDFPVLGLGIVNFPEVFRLLGERGFQGPYTMELEGPLVDGLPVPEQLEKVKACLEYLKGIGAMD